VNVRNDYVVTEKIKYLCRIVTDNEMLFLFYVVINW